MREHRLEKRGRFYSVISLKTFNQLLRTTPLNKKAITAAKFVIAIILFTALLLFSSRITAQNYVEFAVNESANLSTAFIKITANGTTTEIRNLTITNGTVTIYLDNLDADIAYVDLIIDGALFDSRKVDLIQNPAEVNQTDEITEPPKVDKEYKFNSRQKGKDIALHIKGIRNNPLVQTVETFSALDDSKLKFNTDIIAVNESDFESATIYLPKNGPVNTILKCKDWNFDNAKCSGGWANSGIPFEENESYAWFTVESFSGYAGGDGGFTVQATVTECQNITVAGEYFLANSITNSDARAGCINISTSDVLFDGQGYTIDGTDSGTRPGIFVGSGVVNVTVKNTFLQDWNTAISIQRSQNIFVSNNTVYSCTGKGIFVGESGIVNITGNNVSTCISGLGVYGIFLQSTNNSYISYNSADNNSDTGIRLDSASSSNIISSNNASRNSIDGIYIEYSDNNTISNNQFTINQRGIAADNISYSRISDNNISWNGQRGIIISDTTVQKRSGYNNFTNNTVNNNNGEGFFLNAASNNTFLNNTANSNSPYDFYSSSSSRENTIINLNLSGTLASFKGFEYAIRNATSPAADPDGMSNISKYLNVTNNSVSGWLFLNITYNDADLSISESTLKMSKYSGGSWNTATSTFANTFGVDTSANFVYANITNFGSIFAPMSDPYLITSCMNITSPGIYTLTQSITNSGSSACINISVSNVTFNGGGFTIDGDDGINDYGIIAENNTADLSNITIKDVIMTDWYFGIYYENTDNSTILNNSVSSGSVGIYAIYSTNDTIINNTISANVGQNIRIETGTIDILVKNNTVSSGGDGININSDNHTVINNYINSNGDGIRTSAMYLNISYNLITSNTNSGINLEVAANNTISYNTFSNNNPSNIITQAAKDNNITSNIISLGTYGMNFASGSSTKNRFVNNTFSSQTTSVYLQSTSTNNNIFENNTIIGSDTAFSLSSNSNENIFKNNSMVSIISYGFNLASSSHSIIINNTARNNTWWVYYSDPDSINNTIQNFDIDGPVISFKSNDVALRNGTKIADPAGLINVSSGVNATNLSANGWLYLNVSYTDSSLNNLFENTLTIGRHNGTWETITPRFSSQSGVDTANNYVFANITNFGNNSGSIFVPLAQTDGDSGTYLNKTLRYNFTDSTTFVSVLFNSSNQTLHLNQSNNGTFTSQIFDAGESVSWKNISWVTLFPVQKELPINQSIESLYPSGNANMTDNVLLLHLNNDSSLEDGSHFFDLSGLRNIGNCTTGTGCPEENNSGVFGKSMYFNGSVNRYIKIPDNNSLDIRNTITVELWVNIQNTNFHTNRRMIEKDYSSSWAFISRSDSTPNGLAVWINGGSPKATAPGNVIPMNQWAHLAFTYDKNAGGTDEIKIYVNGIQVGTGDYSTAIGIDADPIYLGNYQTPGSSYNFPGNMDEVAIYNRSLSAQEIKDHYLRGALNLGIKVRSCDDALCDTEPFIGPNNNQSLNYSELYNNQTSLPNLTLSGVNDNRYFQYRAYFDTLNASYTPELHNFTVNYEASTTCNSCSACTTTMTTDGATATLGNDITLNGRSFCINVGNNNTILDCNGFQIIGNNSINSIGIYLNQQHNTIIRNCNITAFHYGIYTLNNVTNTTIYSNTFDNSTFGFYTTINNSANQYRTVLDFNKFYNTTTAITTSQWYFYDFNITNNTFLLSANAIDISYLTRGIIRNNTINASNKIYNPTTTANINITHNFILNNGTFTTTANEILCLDVGNYYMNLRAANARPKIDCGPHPAVSLITVNETATDNATFGIRTENGNNLVYNNPVVALANANWNSSATVQFISGSRQFNLTNNAAFYVKNVENTTLDCSRTIINANATSLLFQDTEALSIGNCTIINASKAIYLWGSVGDGSDRNRIIDNLISNSSYGIYFNPGVVLDANLIKDTRFDNISQSAIYDVSSSQYVDYTNITNVTIIAANIGLDLQWFRYTSVTNSTINGTTNSIKIASSSSNGNVSRNNISGPLNIASTTSKFCVAGFGNYYTDFSAARTRTIYDECGPHPAVSLINVDETAPINGSFGYAAGSPVNYNHPTLAIGNANWNGSTVIRFVDSSRQFNLTKQTEIYNHNAMNITLDCNNVIINANSTSIRLQNVRNITVANCTIINASAGLYFISNATPGANDNKIFNNYIHNSSYGIYLEPDGSRSIYRNNIQSNLIRNATVAGIYITSYYTYNTNITNNTIDNSVKAIDISWFEQGLINNNSFSGKTNSMAFSGVSRNNITRNNLTGPVSAGTIGQNIFCLDVGNAYLDEAAAAGSAPNDCGPTPYIGEIRVDSANSVNRFQYGSTTVTEVNYSSLLVAAANAGNNTIIIVVNDTSKKFNGTVSLRYKFNVTINCNGTTIARNGNTVDSGVDMRNTQSSSVKNCNITGFNSGTSTGILMTGNNQSLVDNVSFSTPGTYGIQAATGTASRINVTNSQFRAFTAGIFNYGTGNDFWRIEGNYFANNTDGIYSSQNGYMSVINNTFYGQTGAGIDVAWYRTNNSIFEFNNFTLNVNGIDLLDYDTQRNNFTNNTFYSKSGAGYAIRITGTTPTGNMFWNNTFYPGVNITSSDTGNDNYFNDSRQGNQWMEYDTSAEGCVDANEDTFCDTNYSITGASSESDWLPFSINPLSTTCSSCSACTTDASTNGAIVTLGGNLTSNARGFCINAAANNTIIDCNGYSITGNNSVNSIGVYINEQSNVTVQNCNISSFDYDIYVLNNLTDTKILNNTFDNSTYGVYTKLNASTGTKQYRTSIYQNTFYNATYSINFEVTTVSTTLYLNTNITNNTFWLSKYAINGSHFQQTIIKNNTINASIVAVKLNAATAKWSNVSRNTFVNGTISEGTGDYFCLDNIGNYYPRIQSVFERPVIDWCGPHPSVSLIQINETATNNATFGILTQNWNNLVYNHPTLALGNANWNGSGIAQFVDGSRQFNFTQTTAFIINRAMNTTLDCNGVIINANSTSLKFINTVNVTIANCTIMNASRSIWIRSDSGNGADYNKIINNSLHNQTSAIYLDSSDIDGLDRTQITNNLIRNATVYGIFAQLFLDYNNITNNIIEYADTGIYLSSFDTGIITNNSINGITNSITLDSGSDRNNVTRNNISGAPTNTDSGNKFCLDVGNAYLDETSARTPAFADCGPTPLIREIRVDTSQNLAFTWNSTTPGQAIYPSLAIATANAGSDTIIIVTNQTSKYFNGSIDMQYKSNLTIDCNGTSIRGITGLNTEAIDMSYSAKHTIRNCNITNFDNAGWGIRMLTTNKTIIDNVTFQRTHLGLYIGDNVRGINVTNNRFNRIDLLSSSAGIQLGGSQNFYWIFENNYFSNDSNGITGSALAVNSYHIIKNNTFYGNTRAGIYIDSSGVFNESTIEFNNFTLNKDGIYFEGGTAVRNNITNNSFFQHTTRGISIVGNGTMGNNIVNNTFNGLNSNVSSRDTGNDNYFNDSRQGNHWHEYDTSDEGCVDANSDTFCDTPYIITGISNESDWLPFSINALTCNSCSTCTTSASTNGAVVTIGANLVSNSRGFCINAAANNTIIDCNGFSITGNNSVNSIAVYINEQSNVTVQNCNISSFDYGVYILNNLTDTKILNNTFDNSTYGIYTRLNATAGTKQYRTVIDKNLFYNATYSINFEVTTGSTTLYLNTNITNNTFLLSKTAINGTRFQQTIIKNNTINASIVAVKLSGTTVQRSNVSRNIFVNGTILDGTGDYFCLDNIGNYYPRIQSVFERPKVDWCGPHPMVSLVQINETATNNASFGVLTQNWNTLVYNHPTLALGNANWNGSGIAQFVDGSRQFNFTLSNALLINDMTNTTLDCNGVIINANSTSLKFINIINVTIANCTIMNASKSIWIISDTGNGADYNKIINNSLHNQSTAIYLDSSDLDGMDYTQITNNLIRNATGWGIYADLFLDYTNIIGNTIEYADEGIEFSYFDFGIIQNNSINAITTTIDISTSSDRNNITRNNFSGAPTSTDSGNKFCIGVGNAYLDEAAARTPAFADCGPTPLIREIRVDTSQNFSFIWNSTTPGQAIYPSLAIATANAGSDTIIIVTNQTSKYFNGSIDMQYKSNLTIDCNGTSIRGITGLNSEGIDMSNSAKHTIRNCNITNFNNIVTSHGIQMGITNYTIIDNVTFERSATGIDIGDNVMYINVTNNIFNRMTVSGSSAGIALGGTKNFYFIIENNYFSNSSNGISGGSGGINSYHIIKNNTFYGNTRAGIDADSSGVFNESTIEFNNFTLNDAGIYFEGGTAVRNNITNNSFFQHTTRGISIVGTGTTGNNFVNNTFNGLNSNISSADTGNDNYFNDSRQGNHWYEYDTSDEGCVDANSDTFCDINYSITGSSSESDWLPFSINAPNAVPTQGTPILNSSSGTNRSNENLTVYNISTADTDNDAVKNIINWNLNGSSLTLLNTPFEKNGNNLTHVTDYSTNGNNLTNYSAVWNGTAGYNGGGAFEFDGINSYLQSKPISHTANKSFTISLWIYPKSDMNNYNGIITNNNLTESGWTLMMGIPGNANRLYFATPTYGIGSSAISINQWHHVAAMFNFETNTKTIYVDGVANGNTTGTGVFTRDITTPYAIGRYYVDSGDYLFNGTIDEVVIYNRSLSAEQIQALYLNQTNRIVQQETWPNEIWQACITPNDGNANGNTGCSNNLTILGNIPTITQVNATNGTNAIINATSPAEFGQNITINIIASVEGGISAVWVKVWKGIIGLSDILFEGFAQLINGVYKVNVTINSSFTAGLINYTVYVNSSLGQETNYSSNFTLLSSWVVENCMNISLPGTYKLIRSITNSDATTCINITTSDVIFDGQGFTLDGQDNAGSEGIYAHNSTLTNITIKNLILSDWAKGIAFDTVNRSSILDVNSSSSTSRGVELYASTYNNITNLTAYRNAIYGLDLQQNSDYNIVSNSDLSFNDGASGTGLIIEISSNFNNITNNTANSNNKKGIYIYTANNNLIINNTARNNIDFDFFSEINSIDNKAINLNVGPIISFNAKDMGITNATAPAADPILYNNISKWVNVTNQSADSWLYLNISYTDEEISGLSENSLIVGRYNGSWETAVSSFASPSGVVAGLNYAFANITSFNTGRIFAPFGQQACTSCSVCSSLLTANNAVATLESSITYNGRSFCINAAANNTIIDCNGYSITGNNSANSVGLYINGQNNITVKNCNISGFHYDINITGKVNDTTIFNNTFDNSTYGVYLDANARNQYRLVLDSNKFYNTTTAVYYESTGGAAIYYNSNLINNTFLLVKNAIDGYYYQQTILRNNTINASVTAYNSGASCCAISRGNLTHNFILNNGTLDTDATDNYCLDVGNFYVNVRATNSRPPKDCGPHPSLSLIRINETATNNATFSVTNSNLIIYNNPVLALGNANWNGSALVQFVSGSRQFNISSNTDEVFYSVNVANTTFDCNGVTIWANKTTLGIQNYVNTTIKNCIIKNASRGLHILSTNNYGFDNNTVKDISIYNTSYGIYLQVNGESSEDNLFDNITIINASTAGFYFTGASTNNNNVTNSRIDETPTGLFGNNFDAGIITNNSILGTTNPLVLTNGQGDNRNNVTRNNFSGGPLSTDINNRYCLDIGNAYLDEASARSPAAHDCGPTPYVGEIRVDPTLVTAFTWGTTDTTKVNYASLVIAAANAADNTIITVVNPTTNNFNGSLYLQHRYNFTLNCNGTGIARNGESISQGIDIRNSQGLIIKNCNISGFSYNTATGILMGVTNQTLINNVTFTTPGTYGIDASAGNVKRINVTNSRFSWFSTAIWAYTGSLNNYFWLIENNYLNNNTIGIYPSHYMTIKNNTFYGQITYGIAPTGGISMNQSVIEFNNFTLNNYGIYLNDAIRNNITNNSFFWHTNYGISFISTSSTGNMVWNNSFVNTNVSSIDTDNDNYFNDSRQGNHWYLYDTAAEGCPNTDGNTFCDTNYSISGSSSETDWLPFSIETDTAIPSDITLNAPINGFNSTLQNILFNISVTDDLDANLTCNITLDGLVNKTIGVQSGSLNSSSVTIANIPEGNHLWNVTCNDNWLLSNTSATNRITVDTTTPTINLSFNDTALEFNRDSILVNWNATDTNLDRYYANVSYPNGSLLNQLTNKSQAYTLGPNNLTLTGTYNVTIYAVDGAENSNSTSLTFTVTDSTLPLSLLIIPLNNTVIAIKNSSLVCNATDDILSNISLYTNVNGSWSVNATQTKSGINNQSNFTVDSIADGVYTWNCLAKDASNNQAFNSTNYTFTIDTTMPSSIILNSPENLSNYPNGNISFNISATDNLDANLTCNITLDGLVNKTIGVQSGSLNISSVSIENIPEGNHLWNTTCYDNANNSNISVTNGFLIDTSMPGSLIINSPIAGYSSTSTSLEINFSATDNFDTNLSCSIRISNTPISTVNLSNGTSYFTTTTVSAGTFDLNITCSDDALNSNSTVRSFTITTPPSTPPGGAVGGGGGPSVPPATPPPAVIPPVTEPEPVPAIIPPAVQDILPPLESIISNAIGGIVGNVAPVPLVVGGRKTEEGIELTFGKKGVVKLSSVDKKPMIKIELGDNELELSVPEYPKSAWTSGIMFGFLLLLAMLTYGGVHIAYEKYKSRVIMTDLKREAIRHVKIVFRNSKDNPSIGSIDKCMSIFSIYAAKELHLKKATYKTIMDAINDRNEGLKSEITTLYTKFAQIQTKEVTKREMKTTAKAVIALIKKL